MSTKPKPRKNMGKRKSLRKQHTIKSGIRTGNAISGGRWIQPAFPIGGGSINDFLNPPP